MEFEKYKYEVRALMLRMAKLTVEAAANEDIKKEPQIRQDFFEGRCRLLDFLTVKEYAELKECSERYVKRLCKEGKILSEQRPHPQNKKLCYMIPVSALSEELKIKYYKNLKSGVKLAPELNESPVLKSSKKTVKKRLEEYTESERNEIALWCGILQDWQSRRIKYKNKCEFDSNYIGECRLKYEKYNLRISTDILYKKYASYRENNYDGLIDKRGGWNKGISFMDDDVWKMFTRLYLTSSRPTVSRCYTDVKAWLKSKHPELYASLPSERSFRRRIKNEIPQCVLEYTRNGEKACFDKYCEYIERDYTDLNANEIWIATIIRWI